MADRLVLLSYLAERRNLGDHPQRDSDAGAPPSGPRGDAERGDPGQPVGQDQSQGGLRGYDAHKKVMGRKRHLLVDTQGFALKVVVSAADTQDRDGARLVAHALQAYGPQLPRLTKVWADAGYSGPLGDELREQMSWDLEIVKRSDAQPRGTCALQAHRWVVERTFAWWGGLRRLSRDYAYQGESSEALIYAGMTHLMLRRMTRAAARSSPAG